MRVRQEHWQIVLDFCEENPEIITNKFHRIDGKSKAQIVWGTLAYKLNGLGYGHKTTEEWRKALTDWKSKTKAKAAKINRERIQTGGGPNSFIPLSELEERLLNLMGNKAIEGDRVGELGFGQVIIKTTTDSSDEVHLSNRVQHLGSTIDNVWEDIQQPTNILDHNYTQNENRENQEQTEKENAPKEKRKNNQSEKFPKRLRSACKDRLSTQLIELNKDSLQTLENINSNVASIANSLNIIANCLSVNTSINDF